MRKLMVDIKLIHTTVLSASDLPGISRSLRLWIALTYPLSVAGSALKISARDKGFLFGLGVISGGGGGIVLSSSTGSKVESPDPTLVLVCPLERVSGFHC